LGSNTSSRHINAVAAKQANSAPNPINGLRAPRKTAAAKELSSSGDNSFQLRHRPKKVISTGDDITFRHSVYIGREMLGRYVQSGTKIKAFDASDRPLGNFRVRARALAAIRKAAGDGLFRHRVLKVSMESIARGARS
jgi:hypothetical protein